MSTTIHRHRPRRSERQPPSTSRRRQIMAYLFLCLSFIGMSFAFVPIDNRLHHHRQRHVLQAKSNDNDCTRRRFLDAALGGSALLSSVSISQPSYAAMQNSQTTFTAGKELTLDQALQRFQEAQASLQYLLDNYDEICQGGGDNVRRYLGTVGVSSGLYGISKVLKILKDQADVDDIVEFSELSVELEQAINQADGSAYMAIFTTSSTSGVPPERYYNDAKTEIKNAAKTMQALQKQLPPIKQ